jgi:hypothetical protein
MEYLSSRSKFFSVRGILDWITRRVLAHNLYWGSLSINQWLAEIKFILGGVVMLLLIYFKPYFSDLIES